MERPVCGSAPNWRVFRLAFHFRLFLRPPKSAERKTCSFFLQSRVAKTIGKSLGPGFAKVKSSRTSVAVERSINAKEWSSNRADMSVYPTTQGPVDSYRPIYKVDETHKVSATGFGRTEEEAIKSAIYNCCSSNNCDYIAAAQRVVRVWNNKGQVFYKVAITGFPAVLTSVQTIKAAFYEEQEDGSLKPMETPEHRYVYTTNRTWRVSRLEDRAARNLDSENVVVKPELRVKSIESKVREAEMARSTRLPVRGTQEREKR